jgi:hypothetical protein
VNTAVRVTRQVVSGLARAFRIARAVLSPFVHLLGGTRNAATVAGLAFLALKTRSLLLASGFSKAAAKALLLRARLLGLGKLGPLAIAVAVGFELVGPIKKLFEDYFGADLQGLSKEGDIRPGIKTDTRTQRAANVVRELRAQGLSEAQIKKALSERGFSNAEIVGATAQPSGEDVGLRGAGARGAGVPTGAGGRTRAGRRLGFTAHMAKLELQLSQAELTKRTSDDKAILQQQASLLRARIANGKGSVAERTELNNQLKGVNDQLASLDKDGAAKEKDANKKKLSLKKKQAEADKEHMQKLRERLKADTEKMNEAIDTARGQFGELFTGSVLQPTEEQHKRA